MANVIPMFAFNGTQLRGVMIDEEPWFVANDAIRCLQLGGNASNHCRKLDDQKPPSCPSTVRRSTAGVLPASPAPRRPGGALAIIAEGAAQRVERPVRSGSMADAAIGERLAYEHFLLLARAAAAGMGMASIPSFLIRSELESVALGTPLEMTVIALPPLAAARSQGGSSRVLIGRLSVQDQSGFPPIFHVSCTA